METNGIIMLVLRLLGSLALLMYGMKTMSDALQKMAGPQLRHVLGAMTTNRFTGMLTGILVTAAVQSSTATTVMTVSFVSAGLLTLAQAISVIMGANIGTTLTAWIMSAGFSFNITDFVWPSFVIAIILIYNKKRRTVGDFLYGVAFMFLGLGTLRQTGVDMHLGEQQAVLDFFSSFDPQSFTTTITFLIIGGILTMCVQSSAAVMAITMILCSSGVLPIYQGIALVMGENIGTTVTSNIVALSAGTQARRAALAHMFFNVFGVCWILCVFQPFVDFVCSLVGYDVTMTKESVSTELFLANAAKLSFVLAAFHTCFNLVNTGILIWFIPQIEKLVCAIIKPKATSEEEDTRLRYISSGIMKTPEISVLQAQKEIALFATRIQRMYGMVRELFNMSVDPNTKNEDFQKLFIRIEKYEDISDNMEIEIARYLEQVSDAHLSDETKAKIRSMMRQISEIESIGDACYNLARTLHRKQEQHKVFTEKQREDLLEMINLTDDSLTQMNRVLTGHREDLSITETNRLERHINELRDHLKAENINSINDHEYDYAVGTMFTDLINECEKLGDYVVNVVEARLGK
ncbi:MAG: Na/Pi cotransporter family protein [Bacteroidales bacterium]|nr:Na/Pi cotransporter family protein [Bacteroidales bacterium]